MRRHSTIFGPEFINNVIDHPRLYPKSSVKEVLKQDRQGDILTTISLPVMFGFVLITLIAHSNPDSGEYSTNLVNSNYKLFLLFGLFAFTFIYWAHAIYFIATKPDSKRINEVLAKFSKEDKVDVTQFMNKNMISFLVSVFCVFLIITSIGLIPVLTGY